MSQHKLRSVNTHFWDDNYIITLDPIEKLLFLYLITNPLTTIAGIYEIALRRIAFDTGIEAEMVLKILKRFEEADKVTYREGWIFLHNFFKNQNLSDTAKKGALKVVNDCPHWIKDRLCIDYDSLCIAYDNKNKKGNIEEEEENKHKSEKKRRVRVKTNPNGDFPKSTGKTQQHIDAVMDGLRTRMKLNALPSEPGWLKAAEWAFDNGYEAATFLECYDLLKNQKWRTGRISPRNVEDNLPELDRLKTAVAQNGHLSAEERAKEDAKFYEEYEKGSN